MRFKFKGKTYKIVEEDLTEEECVGTVYFKEGLIKIDPNAQIHKKQEVRNSTLLHEILHVLFSHFSKLKYGNQGYGYLQGTIKEEDLVLYLEKTLMEAVKNNKSLFRKIFKL